MLTLTFLTENVNLKVIIYKWLLTVIVTLNEIIYKAVSPAVHQINSKKYCCFKVHQVTKCVIFDTEEYFFHRHLVHL